MNGLENAATDAKASLLQDLQAAQNDANRQTPPDTIAANCYGAQIRFLKAFPDVENSTTPIGPVQLFQMSRDVDNALTSNDKNSLKVLCAPLWIDERQHILQLASAVGISGLLLAK